MAQILLLGKREAQVTAEFLPWVIGEMELSLRNCKRIRFEVGEDSQEVNFANVKFEISSRLPTGESSRWLEMVWSSVKRYGLGIQTWEASLFMWYLRRPKEIT